MFQWMHSQEDLVAWWFTRRCQRHGLTAKRCGLHRTIRRMGRPAVRQLAIWKTEG